MTGTNERRTARRIPFFTEASLEGMDVSRTDVRIADLSVIGAFVDTRMQLPAGSTARLQFSMGEKRVAVTVQVRYSVPPIGIGLSFLDLSEEDRKAIEEFVAAT